MKTKNDTKYAAEFRAIRAWLKWTRAQLAAELGISTQTIYNYEHALTVPTIDIWERLRKLKDDHKNASIKSS